MKLIDSFKLSVNSIVHRKLRSWLTLLGIIIGIAAVVAIVSIGEGAQASVSQQLSGLGADMLTVSPGFSRAEFFMGPSRGGREFPAGRAGTGTSSEDQPGLAKKDVTIILSNPNVSLVTEIVSGRESVVFLAESFSASIQGVNGATWKETANLELEAGRYLAASDSMAIVIGDRIANSMFKQPITLGRRLSIGSRQFTVVGILKASGSSFGGGGPDSTIFMPLNAAWEITGTEKNTFSSIQAKVADSDLVETTTEELTQSLMLSRKVTENTKDFSITSAQAIQEQVSSVTQTLTLFLAAIAAVSLVVGAVGVANSMFTSVLEKTKEIGILKALGATNNEIMTLFVMESGLFGLAGGIIGVAIGAIASMGLWSLGIIQMPMMRGGQGMPTLVTPELIIIAVILSTVTGIVSGILPARTASKLKPVEALRYE